MLLNIFFKNYYLHPQGIGLSLKRESNLYETDISKTPFVLCKLLIFKS
tara:strand:- start:69 stop:212 length:144 start_codon:yes stop_codon:yes gene_type:complete